MRDWIAIKNNNYMIGEADADATADIKRQEQRYQTKRHKNRNKWDDSLDNNTETMEVFVASSDPNVLGFPASYVDSKIKSSIQSTLESMTLPQIAQVLQSGVIKIDKQQVRVPQDILKTLVGTSLNSEGLRKSPAEFLDQIITDGGEMKIGNESSTLPLREVMIIQRDKLKDQYVKMLHHAYRTAWNTDPDQFFSELDARVKGMIEMAYHHDMKALSLLTLRESNFAAHNSRSVDLRDQIINSTTVLPHIYEMVMQAQETQPSIMNAAPKRQNFPSYKQYSDALVQWLDRKGYDAPRMYPDSQMMSYEYEEMVINAMRELFLRTGFHDIVEHFAQTGELLQPKDQASE